MIRMNELTPSWILKMKSEMTTLIVVMKSLGAMTILYLKKALMMRGMKMTRD